MRFSKAKLNEIYNVVNADYLKLKNGDVKVKGRDSGRKAEVKLALIEKVYKAILGGKVLGWGVFATELRVKFGLSCSQKGVFAIVRAAEEVLDLVLISKFTPRGKKKEYKAPNLEWNRSINAIFGGVKCNLT